MSSPATKTTTPGEACTKENKTPKEEVSPADQKSTLEGASSVETKTTKTGREDKSKSFESSVSKSQIDFNELKTSLANLKKFKEWFWTGNNAKYIILALNNYSFEQNKRCYVRYEEKPPRIYGVVIEKSDKNDHPYLKKIDELGLKLVKVGSTQKQKDEEKDERIDDVKKEIQKGKEIDVDRFTLKTFYFTLDFTTPNTLLEEEQDMRRKVGIKLDKEFPKELNLPIWTEWVITTEEKIGRIKAKAIQPLCTTKDVEPCDRESIEEEVMKIDPQNIAVKDHTIFLRSRNKHEAQKTHAPRMRAALGQQTGCIGTQDKIDRIKAKEKQHSDQNVCTTKDVEPCNRERIEELVEKIDAQNIVVKNDKVVLLSRNKHEAQQTQLAGGLDWNMMGDVEPVITILRPSVTYLTMGCASPDGVNCESTTNETYFKDWFSRADNLKDMIVARNDFSFKENKGRPFVRLEKYPSQIYAVAINEDGQHEHPFWKELYRLGLKLVKIGFTQHETIKGSGNPMEIIQKRIKRELRIDSSPIFCLIIDFTAMTSFREVEEDIRTKIGIKLDKEFAKWLKLPIPTEWVLTSQDIINSLRERIKEKKKRCIEDKTMYTTKDMEPCDLRSMQKSVNEINLPYVGLKDNKIVMRTEEEVLVESFKKALTQFV